MLDSFIIEELKKREERERQRARHEQPRLDLPVNDPKPHIPSEKKSNHDKEDKGQKRGVVIIDI
ncbi:MAG: hypothetical protein JW841_06935 [Deltaproteobacteria bacterium]|nr:hypothetical protein [Deltaproteobacteria bacterium]